MWKYWLLKEETGKTTKKTLVNALATHDMYLYSNMYTNT